MLEVTQGIAVSVVPGGDGYFCRPILSGRGLRFFSHINLHPLETGGEGYFSVPILTITLP